MIPLVPIGVAFGAPPAKSAWLVTALYLATAVGQPVIGRSSLTPSTLTPSTVTPSTLTPATRTATPGKA